MSNFKPKPKNKKKIRVNKKMSLTLDGKHNEILDDFCYDENVVIPELKKEMSDLKKKLEMNMSATMNSKKTNTNINTNINTTSITKPLSIDEKMNIQDRINEIVKEIEELKKKKKDYLLDNSKLVFEYFENKKNISSGVTNTSVSNKKLVDDFFKIKRGFDSDNEDCNNNDKDTTSNTEYSKYSSNIVHQYLSNIDDKYLDMEYFISQVDICRYCNKGELISNDEEGVLLCNNCFRNHPYLIENEKSSYKEPPKEVCFYAYKRINHFKEILSQFQGKETTQIPQEVIDNIKLQIKKERINTSQITNMKTKEILKKLGFNKYYEHIPFIKDKLGIKPPIMSTELEEKLCKLFIELQAPYSKFCPNSRVNFLNYYYTAYKLCQLLGETSYLDEFPMLKDREKRIEQDNIWKKICEELDWEFIPTN
jgi:regulator of replication initiation timing